jgi:hypothetical protein
LTGVVSAAGFCDIVDDVGACVVADDDVLGELLCALLYVSAALPMPAPAIPSASTEAVVRINFFIRPSPNLERKEGAG